ncbi:MAG: PLP-dependent aminotransferase family protein [Salinivirgaceae bacterium]|jgi:DNA-binding transcriptional MocR family regulator|nr:PLP-dependent aminotransferase family protein [Salinivirgaceae bacterium]
MILMSINKNSRQPVFQQIFEQIKIIIEEDILSIGEKLPSTRKLAESLGVHRTTVYRAYEELWAAGYLESNIGGNSRVRQRPLIAKSNSDLEISTFDWSYRFSNAANLLYPYKELSTNANNVLLDFRPLSPDADLLPIDDYRKCMNTVLKNDGANLLNYGSSYGYKPLREQLAKQLQQHSISTSANEIVLTNGIQNGLELVLRSLCNTGDCIFSESPSYTKGLWLMKFLNLKVVEIPMTQNGVNIKALEQNLKKHKPKAIYTMPTFHNPMGISSSQEHREQLLALCEKYQIPLIEDGFEEEMKYFGKAVLPIKSMDRNKMVIYMGTFSKILFPGIRIGWIVAAEPLITKLGAMKQTTELSGISITQAAVHEFCKRGYYELHKKRIHRVYRKRMQQALQACREFLPLEFIHYSKPEGGYLMWFTLKNMAITESQFIQLLSNSGVAVSPGSQFFINKPKKVHFRFSIAHRKENEIRDGIIIIGNLLKKL